MSKRKIISIFYILIIFNSNSLIKSCRDFHITKDMFNLNDMKYKGNQHVVDEKYNLDLKAFSYDYLDELEQSTMHTLINYYMEANEAKKQEINLFGLIDFVKNNMRKIGYDVFSSEEELKETKIIIKSEINKNSFLTLLKKNDLLSKLNDIDITHDSVEKNSYNILDTTVSVTSLAFSCIAVNYINLPFIPSSLLMMSLTLSVAAIVSYIYNFPKEEIIQKAKIKAIRTSNMLEMVYYQISLIKWEGNNLILTAISSMDYCNKYDVKFDYDNEIKYNNWDSTIKRMARRTCKLKTNECNNQKECRENVLKYIECHRQIRKGKKHSCPDFDPDDCSLEFYDKKYDL